MKPLTHALCALLLLGAVSQAQETLIVDADGKLWYSSTGSGGAVPAEQHFNIIRLGDGTPTPQPTPPPEPEGVAGRVKKWAEDIDEPGVAAVLEQTYQFIADQIDSGRIQTDRASLHTSLQLAVLALDEVEKKATIDRAAWDDFLNQKLATEINSALGSDGQMTKAEGVTLFEGIAEGLRASHEGDALPPVFNEILQQLLTMLLQWLLSLLFPGG